MAIARASGIIARSKQGRILMVRRTDGEGWAFPGGGIKRGESAEAAAYREFFEETGHRLGQTGHFLMQRVKDGVDFTTYVADVDDEFCPRLNHEHSAYGWFDPNEVLEEMDGAQMSYAPSMYADDAGWDESKHKRGQPENAGQFGPGGGGGGGGGATPQPEPKTEQKNAPTKGMEAQGQAKPKPGAEGAGQGEPEPGVASKLFQEHPAEGKTADDLVAEIPGMAEKIAKVKERLAQGVPTDYLHKKDGEYTPERKKLHQEIMEKVLSDKAVKAATPLPGEKPTVTFLGGRGGSGKSWITKKGAGPADDTKAITLNSDDVQEHLPEYKGWNAAHTHDEAAEIVEAIESACIAGGLNTILDATMRSEGGVSKKLAKFKEAGYDVHGYYMFLPPEKAAKRALERFERGGEKGRYVPPEYTLGSTTNEKNFDKLTPHFKQWGVYKNTGKAPEKVAEGSQP